MSVQVTSSGRLPTRVWDAQASREAAIALRDAIAERVFVRGLDAADRPLKPYTPATRKALAQAGESGRVDLQQTGELRRAVETRSIAAVTEATAVIEISADQMEKAERLSDTRPFWGVSPTDEQALAEAVPGILARAVERGERT